MFSVHSHFIRKFISAGSELSTEPWKVKRTERTFNLQFSGRPRVRARNEEVPTVRAIHLW